MRHIAEFDAHHNRRAMCGQECAGPWVPIGAVFRSIRAAARTCPDCLRTIAELAEAAAQLLDDTDDDSSKRRQRADDLNHGAERPSP